MVSKEIATKLSLRTIYGLGMNIFLPGFPRYIKSSGKNWLFAGKGKASLTSGQAFFWEYYLHWVGSVEENHAEGESVKKID